MADYKRGNPSDVSERGDGNQSLHDQELGGRAVMSLSGSSIAQAKPQHDITGMMGAFTAKMRESYAPVLKYAREPDYKMSNVLSSGPLPATGLSEAAVESMRTRWVWERTKYVDAIETKDHTRHSMVEPHRTKTPIEPQHSALMDFRYKYVSNKVNRDREEAAKPLDRMKRDLQEFEKKRQSVRLRTAVRRYPDQRGRGRRHRDQAMSPDEYVEYPCKAVEVPQNPKLSRRLEREGLIPLYGRKKQPPASMPEQDFQATYTQPTQAITGRQRIQTVISLPANKLGPLHIQAPVPVKIAPMSEEDGNNMVMLLKERGGGALPMPVTLRPGAKGKTEAVRAIKPSRQTELLSKRPWFAVEPAELVFPNAEKGHTYQKTFQVLNTSTVRRSIQCQVPSDPAFNVVKCVFPGEGSFVAPGLTAKCTVEYKCLVAEAAVTATLEVRTGEAEQNLTLEIRADAPEIDLKWTSSDAEVRTGADGTCELDSGYGIVGSTVRRTFLCRNDNIAGEFSLLTDSGSGNVNEGQETLEVGAVVVKPCRFFLDNGEERKVTVTYFAESLSSSVNLWLNIWFNESQRKPILLSGAAEQMEVDLTGDDIQLQHADVSGKNFCVKYFNVTVPASNRNFLNQSLLTLENLCHSDLKYEWRVEHLHYCHGFDATSEQVSVTDLMAQEVAMEPHVTMEPQSGNLPSATAMQSGFQFTANKYGRFTDEASLWAEVAMAASSWKVAGSEMELSAGSPSQLVCLARLTISAEIMPSKLAFHPPVVVLPRMLAGQSVNFNFQCTNSGPRPVEMDWLKSENEECVDEVEVIPAQCSLPPGASVECSVALTPRRIPSFVADLRCLLLPDNSVAKLQVRATHVEGPQVVLKSPRLDFGIVRRGVDGNLMLEISNLSQVPAQTFLADTSTPSRLRFLASAKYVLPAYASRTVVVSMVARDNCVVDTVVECRVAGGKTVLLPVTGVVDSPVVTARNGTLRPGCDVFMGVCFTVTTTLSNHSSLPAAFSWKLHDCSRFRTSAMSIVPESGVLDPKEELDFKFNVTVNTPGDLDDLLAWCDVQGMQQPVLVRIECCVRGPATNCLLDTVHFGQSCGVRDSVETTVYLHNSTPVATQVTCSFDNFPVSRAEDSMEATTRFLADIERDCAHLESRDLGARMPSGLGYAEAENFERMPFNQSYMHKARELEVSSVLLGGRGVALLCDPPVVELPANASVPVTVRAYADMWGVYRDELVCQAPNMEEFRLPVHLSVAGCPLEFMTSSLITGKRHRGMMNFGPKPRDASPVQRPLQIANASSFDIRLDWTVHGLQSSDDITSSHHDDDGGWQLHMLEYEMESASAKICTACRQDRPQVADFQIIVGDPFPPMLPPDGEPLERLHYGCEEIATFKSSDDQSHGGAATFKSSDDQSHGGAATFKSSDDQSHGGAAGTADGDDDRDDTLTNSALVPVYSDATLADDRRECCTGGVFAGAGDVALIKTRISPCNGCASGHPFSIHPTQVVVPAHGKAVVQAVFEPHVSHDRQGYKCALARGYLSLDAPNPNQLNVHRCQGYAMMNMELWMTSLVEPEKLDIDEIGDTPWTVLPGQLNTPEARQSGVYTSRRLFMLHNTSQARMQARLSAEAPFQLMTSSVSSLDAALNTHTQNISSIAATAQHTGMETTGIYSVGQTTTGQTTTGQTTTGQTATGQTATGQTATGQTATGQTATGQTSPSTPVAVNIQSQSVTMVSIGFLLRYDWLQDLVAHHTADDSSITVDQTSDDGSSGVTMVTDQTDQTEASLAGKNAASTAALGDITIKPSTAVSGDITTKPSTAALGDITSKPSTAVSGDITTKPSQNSNPGVVSESESDHVFKYRSKLRIGFEHTKHIQEYALTVAIPLPRLQLVDEFVDFGAVHLGRDAYQVAQVKNLSKNIGRWSIDTHYESVSGFSFRTLTGLVQPIEGPDVSSSGLINIKFRPQDEEEYSGIVIINVYPCGNSLRLSLYGRGTRDEASLLEASDDAEWSEFGEDQEKAVDQEMTEDGDW